MKALTFLGAGNAYETTYVMPDGREYAAPFFGPALARFYPDMSMSVFVTSDARKKHWDLFQRLTEDSVADLEAVDILDGADTDELWHLFQTVIDSVDQGDTVIFDITHGFRSLPFLSFLAAAYLRTVKEITLEAVLYGNFEARDQSVVPNRAPVIDLTDFVSLLNWMTAADRFVRFGDAQDLAAQIRAVAPESQLLRRDMEARRVNQELNSAAGTLDRISKSLRLIRPTEAIVASSDLEMVLSNASSTLSERARPFLPLSRQVIDAYSSFGLSKEKLDRDPLAALSRERALVRWYMERKQYVQAVAVAREWIVTWTMVVRGKRGEQLLDSTERFWAERSLGHIAKLQHQKMKNYTPPEIEPIVIQLQSCSVINDVAVNFDKIGNIRNDLLHAGKNQDAGKADKLERRLEGIPDLLDLMPLILISE